MGGHSEAINIELENSFDIADITSLLEKTPGVIVKDDIGNLKYPMPLYSKNKDEVFVGRIRKDFSHEKALNLWVVADNLRKGAATNAIQIAEKIVANFL
jgi:aspartate-semialdehyde dehydrogenase